ncbi:MAG: LamG domain-containing protein, partial [Lentisphaerae bacterium]|nr:LamG domain-containing protein [Lentisphaerota bacterium]
KGHLHPDYGIPLDPDEDMLEVAYEFKLGTNPRDVDSDNDGTLDSEEDYDSDLLPNAEEQQMSSDPTMADTDDDGVVDGLEKGSWASGREYEPDNSLSPLFMRVMRFGGTATDYVAFPAQRRFGLTNWTVEAWVNPDNGWAGSGTIVRRETGPGRQNYVLGINAALCPTIEFGSVLLVGPSAIPATGTNWTHVAATYNSANRSLKILINGEIIASTTASEPPSVSGGGPVVQRIGENFAGVMDEVRIWGRQLSADEIDQNSRTFLSGGESNLVCYYKFDDSTSYVSGSAGTSLVSLWHHGQVEDYVRKFRGDWANGWQHAGTVNGNVQFELLSTENPVNGDSDNDGLPDWWEVMYGLDPYSAVGDDGAWGDPDLDGLNNVAEYHTWIDGTGANLDPQSEDSDGDGFGDYDSWDTNSVAAFRTWGELYDDGDGIPDSWEVQYMDSAPNTGTRGLDPAYYDANLDPDDDGWDNFAEYFGSYVNSSGILVRGCNPIDVNVYPMPLLKITARYTGVLGNSLDEVAGSPNVRLLFYSEPAMDGYSDATLVFSGASLETRQFTTGHIVQGVNYVFGYLDVNGNGLWEDDTEPAGLAVPFTVGWADVNEVYVNLSDKLTGYPRFSWEPLPGQDEYIIQLKQGSAQIFERRIRRNYVHEGDYLYQGMYGLSNGTYNCMVWYEDYIYGHMYTNFHKVIVRIVDPIATPTPTVTTAHDFLYQYSRNSLEWTVASDSATAYYMLVQGGALTGAKVVPRPYLFRTYQGNFSTDLPFYAGDDNGSGLVWANGRYYVQLQGLTPNSASLLSDPARAIRLGLASPVNGGKSMISGDVYYFGKVANGFGVANLRIIVQSFRSSGFSGTPDGQSQVTYVCNTMSPNPDKGDYEIMGLHSGIHYVRAFIDMNGNRLLDSFEPYGFAKDYCGDFNDYEPKSVDLSGGGSVHVSGTRIIIRDRDTDDDELPDAWEWMHWGHLAYGAYDDPDGDSLNNLQEYAESLMDSDPSNPDTDGDGLNDGEELSLGLNAHLGDSDFDGHSDWVEIYVTRTLANDENDVFRIAKVDLQDTSFKEFVVQWQGKNAVNYQVQISSDLKNWTNAPDGFFAGSGTHRYHEAVSVADKHRYYRVVVAP